MKNNSHQSQHRDRSRTSFLSGFTVGILLTSLVLTTSPVWANNKKYKPPKGDPPRGPLVSNGSRDSCGQLYAIPLTVLAPANHVGRTSTTNPTLAWFVPTSGPYRINLSLYGVNESQGLEAILQLEYQAEKSGVVSFPIPEGQAQLKPGQRYFWEVNLACDPDSDKYDQSFVSVLEIQEPTPALANITNQAPREKAERYAEEGFWFDAISASLVDPNDAEMVKVARTLLLELAEAEGGGHGQYLLQIAETLGQTAP